MLTDDNIRSEAINSINQSFIVQAPAGSGKTSLLVERFVNLLKVCKEPEECLAITFTKKAAFEMRSRVLEKLEQAVEIKSSHTTDIYSRVLANPNKLQILTIDAFCAKLTQKMPILSKFGIDLKITEDPERLYKEAVDRLLATIEVSDSNNLIKLFEYLATDHELIKKLLIDMLAKREQWLPLIVPVKLAHSKFENFDLQTILESNLQQAIEDILADILNYLPKIDELNKILYLAKYVANNLDDVKNNITYCKKITNSWPKADYLDLPIWRGLVELLLNKDGEPRTIVNSNQGFLSVSNIKDKEQKKIASQLKSNMQELLKYLKEHSSIFLSKLQQINILPDPQYDSNNLNILKTLFFLLPELVAHLMLVFEEQQEVDFTQVAIAALEAMGTDSNLTDLALLIDHKLNHILVDEFQDTSVLQFNLLEKLVANWNGFDGRTIFFVGDPMQSIYRFRQANVGLFLKVQQYGIGNIKLKKLYLKTNFRSSKSIINNLNQLFSKIFPSKNDIICGGVSYNEAEAVNNKHDLLEENINNNDLQFFLTENQSVEAANIVELIKKIQKDNSQFSIAILVRTRSQAARIVTKLREHNITYQANDIESLFEQSIICDLISLTRAILHVNDIIAWLALFRGPLVGLKLIDLYALFDESKSDQLFNKLKNYKNNQQLSDDAICRLDYILPILFEAIKKRETILLSKLIKKTWLALGGDLLASRDEIHLAENFFHKLLDIKDIFQIGCIEELIQKHFVSLAKDQQDLSNVQLMTIHKAKGLEFDVVIVPGMEKSTKNFDNPLFLWEERTCFNIEKSTKNNYLLFAPIKSSMQQKNAIYNFIKDSEEERELYEAKRLLYVAMTRAKKKFYGFTCSLTGRSKSFFKFLESHVNFIKQDKLVDDGIIVQEPYKNKSILLQRMPTVWYMENI